MSQNPNLFLSIGKQLNDEYGRVIGKIASFAVTPNGKFDAAFVEQGDGRFLRISAEHLEFDGANVKLISRIKSEANVFCDQIPLIWRKDQALKDLAEKKKISPELYEELHSSFDGVLTQLKSEAQALLEKLDKEIARCIQETKELNYALVHLELEHEIGKVDDQTYGTAFALIQENIRRINQERSDLEVAKSKLSNILLGEKPKIAESEKVKVEEEASKDFASASTSPELPEPPVVVYVKEIGRTGI